MQLQFNLNSRQGLFDLIDGSVDVAVGKSDITADMVSSGQISSMDIFKCLTVVRLNTFLTTQTLRHAMPSS